MKVSEVLLHEIRRRGINRIFGVPGRENASILFNEVEGLEFITARNEFNAGIMAEFTGRFTRQPQVAFCTMGPGATNMVTAAASAMLNRSPLLIVSAQLEHNDSLYNITHQCVDQRAIFEPVTKWSIELDSPSNIRTVLEKAFDLMMNEPLGPVHLSIPTNFFSEDILVSPQKGSINCVAKWPNFDSNEDSMNLAENLIQRSVKPICIIGQEAIRAEACDEIASFCSTWNIPALFAANAKGVLPHGHPLNLGSVSCYMEGILQCNSILDDIFCDTDLIMNIGYQYSDDILPKMWARGNKKDLVHVSAFSTDCIRTRYSPTVEVLGKIDETMKDLLAVPPIPKADRSFESLSCNLESVYTQQGESGKMSPAEVIRVINKHLGDGTLITDIGYFRHHAVLFSRPNRTNQFHTDSGLSSFGSGLPSAMGAQFIDRDKPVFLLCGDGGFQSGCGDLETLVRHRLPVVIVVLNNDSFGLIERYQHRGGNSVNPQILKFERIDYAMLANANGIKGVWAPNESVLEHHIITRDRQRPLLIEVPLQYDYRDKFKESF